MRNTALADLYDDMSRDIIECLADDIKNGFLTDNTGRDGKDYIWFFDGVFNEAIEIESGMIVTDEETLDRLFA